MEGREDIKSIFCLLYFSFWGIIHHMKTIIDIRYENLLRLMQSCGGTNVAFAKALGRPPSFTHAYVRKNNPKNVGHAFARFLEEQLGKPEGWVDTVHSLESPELLEVLRYIDEELWDYYAVASPDEKMQLIELVHEELNELATINVDPNYKLITKLVTPKLNRTL